MTLKSLCPAHLFHASIEVRMKYFVYEVIVDHQILDDVLNELDQKAQPLLARRLILLVGGTGVGKSAVMKKLVARRLTRRSGEMATNGQILPAILVEIEAPDKGAFAFSSLYRSALAEMGAALINRTIPLVERSCGQRNSLTSHVEEAGKRLSPDALKSRFIDNLITRQVELACFDESINLFKVGRVRSEPERKNQLKEQADKLKTFGNKTPATIVLAGAYDFYELTLCAGQIARRSAIIQMEPYTANSESLVGFAKAVVGLLAHLPIAHKLDATVHLTEFFLQSLGCVGTLKTILSEALLLALSNNVPLTIDLVRKCYYTAAQLSVMRNELEIGVKRLRELLTMEQLALSIDTADAAPVAPTPANKDTKLAPGETKPSHRHEATELWRT